MSEVEINELFDVHELHKKIGDDALSFDLAKVHNIKELVAEMTLDEKLAYVKIDPLNIMLFGGEKAPQKLKLATVEQDDCLTVYKKIDPNMTNRQLFLKEFACNSYTLMPLVFRRRRYDLIRDLPRNHIIHLFDDQYNVRSMFRNNRELLSELKDKYRNDKSAMAALLNTAQSLIISYHKCKAVYNFLYKNDEDLLLFALSKNEKPIKKAHERDTLFSMLRSEYDIDHVAFTKAYNNLSKRDQLAYECSTMNEGELDKVNLPEKTMVKYLKKVMQPAKYGNLSFRFSSFFGYRVKDPNNLLPLMEALECGFSGQDDGVGYIFELLLNNLDVAAKMKPADLLRMKLKYNI